jgi:hypothetical protein
MKIVLFARPLAIMISAPPLDSPSRLLEHPKMAPRAPRGNEFTIVICGFPNAVFKKKFAFVNIKIPKLFHDISIY